MDAAIVFSLTRHCTEAHADEIEQFFAAHPIPSSARKIAQSVETIRSTGAMLKRLAASRLAESALWA